VKKAILFVIPPQERRRREEFNKGKKNLTK